MSEEPDIFDEARRNAELQEQLTALALSKLDPRAASSLLAAAAIAVAKMNTKAVAVARVMERRSEELRVRIRSRTPTVRQKTRKGGRSARALALLRQQPRMPMSELSLQIYGSKDQKTQAKTRSLIWTLKKAGRVHNPEPGQWEVTGE